MPCASTTMSRVRKMTKAAIDMPMPNLLISLASLSSCMLSGVFTEVISVLERATLPISVASPTSVTWYVPRPFITIVLRSTLDDG